MELNIAALSRNTGVNYTTLYRRYNLGLRGDALVAPPVAGRPAKLRFTIGGETRTCAGWEAVSGVPRDVIRERMRKCVRGEALLVKGRILEERERRRCARYSTDELYALYKRFAGREDEREILSGFMGLKERNPAVGEMLNKLIERKEIEDECYRIS